MRTLVVVMLLAGAAVANPAKPAKAKHAPIVHDLSDKPVIVKTSAPKPKVVVVPHDGRNVTGRPKSGDRLDGLDHRLR
jgi:hypothetical protein